MSRPLSKTIRRDDLIRFLRWEADGIAGGEYHGKLARDARDVVPPWIDSIIDDLTDGSFDRFVAVLKKGTQP